MGSLQVHALCRLVDGSTKFSGEMQQLLLPGGNLIDTHRANHPERVNAATRSSLEVERYLSRTKLNPSQQLAVRNGLKSLLRFS